MFLAMLLVCTSVEVQSCEIYYNTEEVFVTQEACEADLDEASTFLDSPEVYYSKTGCIVLPGDSA
jgi:hypothetical protein